MWNTKPTDGKPLKTMPFKLMDRVVHCVKIVMSLGLSFVILMGGMFSPFLWEDPTMEEASNIPLRVEEPIYGIEVNEPTGTILVRSRESVAVRDLQTGTLIQAFSTHAFPMTEAVSVPRSREILVGNANGGLKLMGNPLSSEVRFASRVHDDSIRSAVISKCGRIAATGSSDRICLWNLSARRMIAEFPMPGVSPNQLQFSPDESRLLAGCDDGSLRLFRVKDLGFVRHFQMDSDCLAKAIFIEDGRKILAGSLDGDVFIVDSSTGVVGHRCTPCSMVLLEMAVSPDQKWAAFTDWSNQIHLHSLGDLEKIASLEGHARAVSALQFSETEPVLYSGSLDGTVRLWDLQKFAERACYQGSLPRDHE
jgi:WD40 repeat protein